MPLCSACSSIPFSSLPPFPSWLPYAHIPSAIEKDLVPFLQNPHPEPINLQRPLGLPHHQSPDLLRQSAQTCGLCSLILAGYNRVLEARERHVADEVGRFYDEAGGPDGRFWVCARREGQQGFLVLNWSEKRRDSGSHEVYVVAGAGFAVDDVRWPPKSAEDQSTQTPRPQQHCNASSRG
ncbi:hypothetical protein BT63DRAFT_239438 [Microthyrium microscopicum]|uniref:Uncharacterized protein n=1 Tax=Microthyrium microscopicum TaxID=703497 RepID=A0A6A6UDU1_9PEZI|nr:hypothetical protein BT63DRAFT_239438 [Microthyrium microscopicum]